VQEGDGGGLVHADDAGRLRGALFGGRRTAHRRRLELLPCTPLFCIALDTALSAAETKVGVRSPVLLSELHERAPRFIPVNRQPPARVHEGRHFVIESAFTSFTRHEVVEEHWSHLGDP